MPVEGEGGKEGSKFRAETRCHRALELQAWGKKVVNDADRPFLSIFYTVQQGHSTLNSFLSLSV